MAIIPGKGEVIHFKFNRYIHVVHPNKSPLKILEKRSVGVSRDFPKFLVPLLSQERVKIRTSNFVRTFVGSMETIGLAH